MKALAKIISMSRNEYDLIEDFLLYYGSLFGYENIVIVDNGSIHPEVLRVYREYEGKGVTVVVEEGQGGGEWHGRTMTKYMTQVRDVCEFLIPVDTDEFLFAGPAVGQGLPRDPEEIHRYLTALPPECSYFKIPFDYYALIDPAKPFYENQKVTRPARNMDVFWRNENRTLDWGPKTFYRAEAFQANRDGSHHGVVTWGEGLVTELGFFHYHGTGARRVFERASQLMAAYQIVDVQLPLVEQLRVLEQSKCGFAAQRRHEYQLILVRHYLVQLSKQYLKRLPTLHQLDAQVKSYVNMEAAEAAMKLYAETHRVPEETFQEDPVAEDQLVFYNVPFKEGKAHIHSTYVTDTLNALSGALSR